MSVSQEGLKLKTETQDETPQPPALPEEKKPVHNIKPLVTAAIFVTLMTALAFFGYTLIKKSLQHAPSASVEVQQTGDTGVSVSSAEQQKSLKKEFTKTAQQPAIEETPKPRLFKPTIDPKRTIRWPEIDLSGFGSAPDGQLAIINGKIMREGQIVAGATILHIQANKVIMEYQGETRSFSTGAK